MVLMIFYDQSLETLQLVTFRIVIKNCMVVEDCSIQVSKVCLSKLSLICKLSTSVKLFISNLDALELKWTNLPFPFKARLAHIYMTASHIYGFPGEGLETSV
uniref:Uncharacterized protein n=1 Tax=Micrurus lemniscatus lemniscatus TaxID=129467 RepID=A0A2D4J797_MICLE